VVASIISAANAESSILKRDVFPVGVGHDHLHTSGARGASPQENAGGGDIAVVAAVAAVVTALFAPIPIFLSRTA